MKITTVKLFALACTGCALLGVTLAAETNKRQFQWVQDRQQLPGGRSKRGLLSALFGGGGGEEPTQQVVEVPAASGAVAAEVLPIYGDPAQPPLHMLYGHATGLPGPYPPYPVMFIPGGPPVADGTRPTPYLPLLAYGGDGGAPVPIQFQSTGDSNYLPAVAPERPEAEAHSSSTRPESPSGELATKGPSKPSLDVSKSAYLQKLNLSPADEAELKRLSKQLGVTDFEHLPPFEDVMALLGTTTSAETIKAIKEYASTPDGLELIKDYVMSYQPAKRVSLGKQPYTDANGLEESSESPAATTTVTPPQVGFFARQLQRLKSILTFGYYGGAEEAVTPDQPSETVTELPSAPVEVSSELPAFVIRSEFPAFEVRHGGVPGVPVGHYLIPVRALPPTGLSYPVDNRYASTLPFPLAYHYPPEAQYPNPFTVRSSAGEPVQVVQPVHEEPTDATTKRPTPVPTFTVPSEPVHPTVAPQRVAPPTLPTGVVHTFDHVDLESSTPVHVRPYPDPVDSVSIPSKDEQPEPLSTAAGLGQIVVEPELLDITEPSTNTLDE